MFHFYFIFELSCAVEEKAQCWEKQRISIRIVARRADGGNGSGVAVVGAWVRNDKNLKS